MGNKSKKNKPEIFTKATKDKFITKLLVLTIAYLMEEPEFSDNENRLMKFYNDMQEWM